MTPTDIAALMKGVAPALRDMVEATVSPLLGRIADLEERLANVQAAKDGAPGRDGEPGEQGERGQSGNDGKDGAPGRGIAKLLIDANGHLVATFTDGSTDDVGLIVGKDGTSGKDGRDGADGIAGTAGKSIDPATVVEMVAGAIAEAGIGDMVQRAVAALPIPKDGLDGKSIDPNAISEMVRVEVEKAALPDMVQKAVDAIPRPADGKDGVNGEKGQDGADGHSVTVDDVRPVLVDLVETAVKSLPVPQDGRSVTAEDVAPLIESSVASRISEAVKAIPVPKDGINGKDGAPGKLPLARAWVDTVHREADVVTHNGGTYQAMLDTGKEPPHADWVCLAAPGRHGADGRSFAIRGTYADDGEYRSLDVVALNGGAFVARKDDPGPCPGEGWQMLATRGKPGPVGEQGKRGEPGTRGLPGPGIVEMAVDGQGLLTVRNADGSTVECDLYPVLVKVMG